MESEINAFGTSCYRIMLNIKRIDRVSNATIYDLKQTAPLVENVRTRQLRFLDHVLRMRDNGRHARSMHCIFHHMGRGNQEGNEPCFSVTFNTYWQTDNMIGPDKLSELAQERCGWRKLVVAFSAADR